MSKVQEIQGKINNLKAQIKKLMGQIEKIQTEEIPTAEISDENDLSDKQGLIVGIMGGVVTVFLIWFDTSYIVTRAIVILTIIAFVSIQIPKEKLTFENIKIAVIVTTIVFLTLWLCNLSMWVLSLGF